MSLGQAGVLQVSRVRQPDVDQSRMMPDTLGTRHKLVGIRIGPVPQRVSRRLGTGNPWTLLGRCNVDCVIRDASSNLADVDYVAFGAM